MSDLPAPNVETDLGNGLYVSFDGRCIKLRMPRKGWEVWVGLDRDMYRALLNWVAQYAGLLWED